ncbi:MAG: DUF4097 family beta strand repeat protein [Candidatus Fermentithermobacillus carboniphilus]|uniref:DUF4097 family beta strand repeat protein n=1 Tax=Candidatus Fermentithermobacillus carboniphilus TaxID=3085328 RepID=A0AAT9LBN9_9FIRM|nr:MAG: DUF4097 family beta strand repeat protein [Candidatus Fermentithermobacillus carboniphilus]
MSKEEKLLILQMVADGKITPEQGVELLKVVGGPGTREVPAEPTVKPPAPYAPKGAIPPKQAESYADSMSKHFEDLGQRVGETVSESAEGLRKLISSFFGGGGLFAGGPEFELHDEIKGEIPAEGDLDISLRTINGRITVETWDQPGFLLDVKKKISARNEDEAKELLKDVYEFSQDGVSLRARAKESSGNFMGRNASVSFTLTIPRARQASLNLDSANGRITVEGVSGKRCVADTANGRIEVTGCHFGDAILDTANGRIEFDGSASNLKADTANGRIEACLRGAGTWKLGTANGRIEVEIEREEGTGYEIDISSVMGRLEVTGMDDAEVLIDETRQKFGSRRYKARTKGFEESPVKASLKASSSMGRVTVSL